MLEDHLRARGVTDPAVLRAMARVPRDQFVAREDLDVAYHDRPLPIGYGQTISQPYVVGVMLQALQLPAGSRVLEIGTGSGYAAALLGEMAQEVHTVERIPELASEADERLRALGYANVHVHCADGTLGWPPAAPYGGIVVAAGGAQVPPALLEQLNPRARLVLPVGEGQEQRLKCLQRLEDRTFREEDLGRVRFVPLIAGSGP